MAESPTPTPDPTLISLRAYLRICKAARGDAPIVAGLCELAPGAWSVVESRDGRMRCAVYFDPNRAALSERGKHVPRANDIALSALRLDHIGFEVGSAGDALRLAQEHLELKDGGTWNAAPLELPLK